jgi:hypothetical protein
MLPLILATTLVLRSGISIPVEGTPTSSNGRVVFRAIDGTLYSLRADEIASIENTPAAAAPVAEKKKLKLSAEEREKLLRELENNHAGVPAPAGQIVTAPPPPAKDQTEDEWRWRRESRAREEAVRRAKENLTLLANRVERLQAEIRGLAGLGYKPQQFSYQTTQLQSVLEEIPYAELSVTRAQRELDEFRDDARKQGILPGWLR